MDFNFDIVDLQLGQEPPGPLIEACIDCWFTSSGGPVAIGPHNLAPGTYFVGISDANSFQGGALGDYSLSFTITAVDLPASLAGMALATGAIGLLARRRRRRSDA